MTGGEKRLVRESWARLRPDADAAAAHVFGDLAAWPNQEGVGGALLATLAEALGDAFTPAVAAAWRRFHARLAGIVRDGADADRRARAA